MLKLIVGVAMGALFASTALADVLPGGRGDFAVQTVRDDEFVVVARGAAGMSQRDLRVAALKAAAKRADGAGKEWFFVRTATASRVDLSRVPPLSELGTAGSSQGQSRDAGVGAGGGQAGATGGGAGATFGADPGAVGVGTQAPSVLLERAPQRRVQQLILHVQMGSGDSVELRGMKSRPEFLDAKSLAQDTAP